MENKMLRTYSHNRSVISKKGGHKRSRSPLQSNKKQWLSSRFEILISCLKMKNKWCRRLSDTELSDTLAEWPKYSISKK